MSVVVRIVVITILVIAIQILPLRTVMIASPGRIVPQLLVVGSLLLTHWRLLL